MTALVEKIASGGGATRQEVRAGDRQAQSRPSEELHLCVSTADQAVQPEAEFPEVQGPEGRDHQRARGHHPGASRTPNSRGRHGARRQVITVLRDRRSCTSDTPLHRTSQGVRRVRPPGNWPSPVCEPLNRRIVTDAACQPATDAPFASSQTDPCRPDATTAQIRTGQLRRSHTQFRALKCKRRPDAGAHRGTFGPGTAAEISMRRRSMTSNPQDDRMLRTHHVSSNDSGAVRVQGSPRETQGRRVVGGRLVRPLRLIS